MVLLRNQTLLSHGRWPAVLLLPNCRKGLPWSRMGGEGSNKEHLEILQATREWKYGNGELLLPLKNSSLPTLFLESPSCDRFLTSSHFFIINILSKPNICFFYFVESSIGILTSNISSRCDWRLGRNNFRNEWESIYTTSSHFPSSIPVGRDGTDGSNILQATILNNDFPGE